MQFDPRVLMSYPSNTEPYGGWNAPPLGPVPQPSLAWQEYVTPYQRPAEVEAPYARQVAPGPEAAITNNLFRSNVRRPMRLGGDGSARKAPPPPLPPLPEEPVNLIPDLPMTPPSAAAAPPQKKLGSAQLLYATLLANKAKKA